MGKRSNGTRGTNSSNSAKSRKINLDFTDNFSNEVMPPGVGIGSKLEDYAKQLGASSKGFQDALKLIDRHTQGEEIQKEADALLYSTINGSSDIGKALRAIAKVNALHYSAYYKEYKKSNRYKEARQRELQEVSIYANTVSWPNSPQSAKQEIAEEMKSWYSYQDRLRSIPIYRAGGRKNVESWTTSDRGVDFGNVIVRTNLRSTVKDMMKDYYVFGISHSVGIAKENELIFVKKKK